MKYRDNLPQLSGDPFLTDGGLETVLIFHEGLDLPAFAAFDLLKDDEGTEHVRSNYAPNLALAREPGLGFQLEARETNEHRHPSDRLLVRLTNRNGEQLDVLREYSDGDAGGWRRESVDLTRFAGRTVYLSFLVETDPMLRTAFYLDGVTLDNESRP